MVWVSFCRRRVVDCASVLMEQYPITQKAFKERFMYSLFYVTENRSELHRMLSPCVSILIAET